MDYVYYLQKPRLFASLACLVTGTQCIHYIYPV